MFASTPPLQSVCTKLKDAASAFGYFDGKPKLNTSAKTSTNAMLEPRPWCQRNLYVSSLYSNSDMSLYILPYYNFRTNWKVSSKFLITISKMDSL